MKVVVFNPAGGPIIAEVTSGQAQPGSYTLRVWTRAQGVNTERQAGGALPFDITATPTCTSVSVSSTETSPQFSMEPRHAVFPWRAMGPRFNSSPPTRSFKAGGAR